MSEALSVYALSYFLKAKDWKYVRFEYQQNQLTCLHTASPTYEGQTDVPS
jgi:hypothetical protein